MVFCCRMYKKKHQDKKWQQNGFFDAIQAAKIL
jgi:hypothetical protein